MEFLVRDWSNFENVNDDDMVGNLRHSSRCQRCYIRQIREETEEYLSDIMGFRGDEGMQVSRGTL